ncbi:MAG TPA: hypothetical protein EYQ74_14605 [Planctomycetes bacterium]|nr:hypothetical protein [Planctomycetota bacterium]HIK61074.1 hypothetical protein [Planctomycetota bacterium]
MKCLLDLALESIEREVGGQEADLQVERVVVRKDGSLMLFASCRGQVRWFHFEGGKLTERFPGQETALPLLAAMSEEEFQAVQVLAWRPGRRVALLDPTGQETTILKGFRRKRGLSAAMDLERVSAAGSRCETLRFPACLESYPDRNALRMGFMPGGPLEIRTGSADLFFGIGRDLMVIQEHVSCTGLDHHGPNDELTNLEAIAVRTLSATPVPDPSWKELLQSLKQAVLNLPPAPKVFAHRDLHDGQFLVNGTDVALMDFDMIAAADPVLDLANLSAHLQLRVLQKQGGLTQADADTCDAALSEAFATAHDSEAQHRVRFYRSATFLRLAFVYAVRPRWRHLFPDLLQHAQHCFDELREA